jgi:signal transduction histidine kinase
MVVAYRPHQVDLWIPDLTAGIALVLFAAYSAAHSRATSVLGVVTALAWFVGTILPYAEFWHRGLLIHIMLSIPRLWPRSWLTRFAIVAGYAVSVTPYVWSRDTVGSVLALLVFAAVVASSRSERSRTARRAVTVAGALLAAAITGGAAWRALGPQSSGVAPSFSAYCVVVALIALCLGFAVPRRSVSQVTDVVIELGDRPQGDLRASLSAALSDPTIDDALLDTAIERAGRLTKVNDDLNREIAAQLGEVELSRRRILLAADEERHAIRLRLQDAVSAPLAELGSRSGLRPAESGDASPLVGVQMLVRRALDQIDEIGRGLHPRELDTGITAALESLARPGPVRVDVRTEVARLAPEIEAAIYYATAEAVTNSLRHASATGVSVTIVQGSEHVITTIRDDGSGRADPARGTGIRGLVDRIEALGGSVRLTSRIGRGTSIRIILPVAAPAQMAESQ